jgi:uncharacterized protein (DUF58 family)
MGALGSYSWGLALALSMTVTAIASFVYLKLSPKKVFEVRLGPGQKRTFKGEALSFPIIFESPGDEARAVLELLSVPEGAQARLRSSPDQGHTIIVSSRFSGVFTGWSLKVGILDPLGLFKRYEERKLDLQAEFLPSSLLARRAEVVVRAAMLGDRPAGSRGFGQEFYSAEVYDSSQDSKGILWRRQAKVGGDFLMVRVGEANIPETLTICLLESQKRIPRELPGWMDLASEAVSLMGLTVLDSGSSLRVIHLVGGEASTAEARDLKGLANLLTGLWSEDHARQKIQGVPTEAGIIVTGEPEMQDPDVFGLLLRKPAVVLTFSVGKVSQSRTVVFFTGKENVNGLVSEVLSR